MEYEVVEADNIEELNRKVNDMIKCGWKPQGGVSITLSESDSYSYFCTAQAMITEAGDYA